jgi:hypothetical protein
MLLRIHANGFSISKNLLYAIIMFSFIGVVIVPRLWAVATYKHTSGGVDRFDLISPLGNTTRARVPAPVVIYRVDSVWYEVLGSAEQKDLTHEDDVLPVIYDPNNPAKSYVYGFTGFWSPVIAIGVPFILITTLALGIDSIPKIISFRFGKNSSD